MEKLYIKKLRAIIRILYDIYVYGKKNLNSKIHKTIKVGW